MVPCPIFKNVKGTIGENKFTVPGFDKSDLWCKNKMIGLILPNASSILSLSQNVVTVDEIEKETGIDFFSGLDDKLEN